MSRIYPAALLSFALLAGCACQPNISFTKPLMEDPWDTTYLIDANTDSVSIAALTSHAIVVDRHYWEQAQVYGVAWPPWRTDTALERPDRYINGGDSGIFTGYALASFVFKYRTSYLDNDLERAMRSIRGLYILTHCTGTPGVIARCAFPAHRPDLFGYPGDWQGRIQKGFVDTGPEMEDPFSDRVLPSMTYYTRGTRDQLTGYVFGLSAAWRFLDPTEAPARHYAAISDARRVIAEIAETLYNHLVRHDWKIRDEKGRNETSADNVKQLLKAAFLGLYQHTAALTNPGRVSSVQKEYVEELGSYMDLASTLAYGDRFSNFKGYYAYNLRTARSLGMWFLESDAGRRESLAAYYDHNVWSFVKDHQSAWFSFARAVMQPITDDDVTQGIRALKSLTLKPLRLWSSPYYDQEQKPNIAAVAANCTGAYVVAPHLRKPTAYFTWQKEPWDVGTYGVDKLGLGNSTGIDFLLPYWMGRLYGLLRSR